MPISNTAKRAELMAPDRVEIVAEIGVNHDGSLEKAKRLVASAKEAGADYVKFQSFSPRFLALESTPKVAYQRKHSADETHYEMLSRLALNESEQAAIRDFSLSQEIGFFSTPYDPSQVEFLAQLGVPYLKVASADIVDILLLEKIAESGIPPILSTGMATREEIIYALRLFDLSRAPVTLLHAISRYPAPSESLRLDSIPRLRELTGKRVGFSDHSEGHFAGPAATALGAVMVEKHFTLDRDDAGPDHAASADPRIFSKMVESIREVEKMSGYVGEELSPAEKEMKNTSRKSLVYSTDLPAGSVLDKDHTVALRPGSGIPVSDLYHWVGRTLRLNVAAWTQLSPDDFF